MKVQVSKWGNSTAVRLPKAVVRQLGLTSGMTLDVSVEDGAVKLEPAAVAAGERSAVPPEPFPVTAEWLLAEAKRLGGLANAPQDDWDWGRDMGSEIIYDDYNPRPKS